MAGQPVAAKASRNWWKIAFFIMLFLFEGARETAVMASKPQAYPNTVARVARYGGYASAEGSWKRMDGGERLSKGAVTIKCSEHRMECAEISVAIYDNAVMAPYITI